MALVMVLMVATHLTADLVLMLGLFVLLVPGLMHPAWMVLDTDGALHGLANDSVAVIGVLFIVAAGIRETGAVAWATERVFGRPRSTTEGILRLIFPTSFASAFTNNTPLVAMLIPAVDDWAKKNRIASSKVMIPLSYAAILGGTCTLIGTSTNLVVRKGLTTLGNGGWDMGLFDIAWVGVPSAIVGCTFMALFHRWLLPDRASALDQLEDPKEYTVEMLVDAKSPLVGRTIEEAGLRNLPGAFLAEIDRQGVVLPAVSRHERLMADDRLLFVGIVDSVVDLQRTRGLVPATNQVFKLTGPRTERCLIEAVVSDTCPLNGQTIREGQFRSVYQAVVIAVARNGQRIQGKIGDIVLRAGDTLLLEAHESFLDQHRHSRDFFLVSRMENFSPPRHDRAWVALGILLGMVLVVGFNLIPLFPAALCAALLLVVTRCLSIARARQSIEWSIILAIAASFGIAKAIEDSGAARGVAEWVIQFSGGNAWGALAAIYVVTLLTTELITNAAAAALMFPFAVSTAAALDVSYRPFVIAVMMAASAAFATPIGYQTNLMVMGPGGYRFLDYVKIGVPLDLLIAAVTLALAPIFFPFSG
jgi:di/tricarboxylate transporter